MDKTSSRNEKPEANRYYSILENQNLALEKLAAGEPIANIFDILTSGAEREVKGAIASILLLDDSGTKLVDCSSPSLSQEIKDAFNGMLIGPLAGSCGTAAFTKKLVIVSDISSDPRWSEFREFALSQGFKAAFSAPILNSKGTVFGTFALTFPKVKEPTSIELEIIQSSIHIACLAIEQRRSEEGLRLQTKELEEFAYLASHDLKEPLRKIIMFSDRLLTSDCDEAKKKDLIQRILGSAERMYQLTEDISQLSTIGIKPESFEQVNLNQLIKEIREDLAEQFNQNGGVLKVKDLPSIEGKKPQLRRLFQNLISNALKYHKDGVAPLIEFKAECLKNGFCEIQLIDNGIGFNSKYAEKIFEPFSRLHDDNSYQGTGIGLTICKKIVLNHRGEIKIQSEPNLGTTVIVRLPSLQPKADTLT